MDIAKNNKKISEQRGFLQIELSIAFEMHPVNYSKLEKSHSEFRIWILDKSAQFLELIPEELLEPNQKLPEDVKLKNISASKNYSIFCFWIKQIKMPFGAKSSLCQNHIRF